MEAGCTAAGIRIAREAGTTVLSSSYLPDDCQIMCRFLSSRKVALTDAGVRNKESDRTAFIFLPGGLGTMDELFELLCLAQLKKLGSKLKVPIILVNWNGVYTGLMDYLVACDENGVLKAEEMDGLVLANTNDDVLRYLCSFYGLPLSPELESQDAKDVHIQTASSFIVQAVQARKRQRQNNGTSTCL